MTDAEGRFDLPVEPFEGNIFFRVVAGSEAGMTGSEPFRLTPSEPVKSLQ